MTDVAGLVERLRARDETVRYATNQQLRELFAEAAAALAELAAERDRLREALVMYDDKARDVQEHWGDPGGYTHNALLTAQLVHGDTVSAARAALTSPEKP